MSESTVNPNIYILKADEEIKSLHYKLKQRELQMERSNLVYVKAKSEISLKSPDMLRILFTNEKNVPSFMRSSSSSTEDSSQNAAACHYDKISKSFLNSLNDSALSMPHSLSSASSANSVHASNHQQQQQQSHNFGSIGNRTITTTNNNNSNVRKLIKSNKKKRTKAKKELKYEAAVSSIFNTPCSNLNYTGHEADLTDEKYDKIKQHLLSLTIPDIKYLYRMNTKESFLDDEPDDWSITPISFAKSASVASAPTTATQKSLAKSKSYAGGGGAGGKSAAAFQHISNNQTKLRNFKDSQAFLAYYKAEKFAKIINAMKFEQVPVQNSTAGGAGGSGTGGSIININPNSIHTVLNTSTFEKNRNNQASSVGVSSTSNQVVVGSNFLHLNATATTGQSSSVPNSRSVTNIGFRMDNNGSMYKRNSDAFAPNQKFIPYTSQGMRAAGGGTLRINPKAYKNKYQYQFARNLIEKIIATNQQTAKSLLRKNEKYLANAIAANNCGGGGGFRTVITSTLNQNLASNNNNNNNTFITTTNNNNNSNGETDDYSYYSITNLETSRKLFLRPPLR